MNCFYHIENPAVAQCVDCSKGLCNICASKYTFPICHTCNSRRKNQDITYYGKFLALYLVLFIIGYNLDFLSSKGHSNHFASGYILMAIVSGWQFLNKVIPLRFFGSIQFLGIVGLFKLFFSVIVGVFTAPVTIIWNVIKLVRTLNVQTDL